MLLFCYDNVMKVGMRSRGLNRSKKEDNQLHHQGFIRGFVVSKYGIVFCQLCVLLDCEKRTTLKQKVRFDFHSHSWRRIPIQAVHSIIPFQEIKG